MSEARLPTPRNARINEPGDVVPAAELVGFPAVIKPVSGETAGTQALGDDNALQQQAVPSAAALMQFGWI
jgi:formate-dependent phosphoribosylglycinamide formyltransferase (GAR transformylase)